MAERDSEPEKGERFACNLFPNYTILGNKKHVQFKDGEFRTDDQELIDMVVKDSMFGIAIIPDNQALLKKKK